MISLLFHERLLMSMKEISCDRNFVSTNFFSLLLLISWCYTLLACLFSLFLSFALLVEGKAQSFSDDGLGSYRFVSTLGSAML